MAELEPKYDDKLRKWLHPVEDPVTGNVTWVPEDMLIADDMHPNKGRVRGSFDEEHRRKIAESNRRTKSIMDTSQSEETKAKNAQTTKRQHELGVLPGFGADVTCPHCGKSGSKALMTRWHFDNCKTINPDRKVQYEQKTCPHCGKTGSAPAMKQFHFDNCKLVKPRAKRKVQTVTCPHCGKEGGASSMGRWHFDHCKHAPKKT